MYIRRYRYYVDVTQIEQIPRKNWYLMSRMRRKARLNIVTHDVTPRFEVEIPHIKEVTFHIKEVTPHIEELTRHVTLNS